MAAGQGFKTFVTGEVLTAGDVNGYLMQGINVFTNATARDAAITAPAEGQFAFTKDNNSLWYYDGAAWVASGATGDIEGVTAGVGISGGGTSGTVTITNSMATAIDAKGDLVAGTAADTFDRLAVGANDSVLTADSSTATGLKWATPAGSATNYTLLNSGGTSLSGSTTTVSGISNQDKLYILVDNASTGSGNPEFTIRINGDTGSNYRQIGYKTNVKPANNNWNNVNNNDTYFRLCFQYLSSPAGGGSISIYGCKSSGVKVMELKGQTNDTNEGEVYNTKGYWNNSASVTSISVFTTAGTFDAGTVYVYGSSN